MPGSTSVWNSPSTWPPRTFTAPPSVIALSFGLPPVVSRSTTTKVTSASGVPRSSIVAWWNRGRSLPPGPGRATCRQVAGEASGGPSPTAAGGNGGGAGSNGTQRTLGRGSDSPGEATPDRAPEAVARPGDRGPV